ncbi:LemA family protein [Spiroplasma tabanidicola]|uniref:LemA family protein n=1 Tax=Spiroplasma tabanidicola TaxID=324079 RepID=A0A6I6C9T1_9MOLU|nr:LemA family protein [Spiroplasma tabanidicola]QGS51685.1 LemA family protein [Spiroplasma tabanidicola]
MQVAPGQELNNINNNANQPVKASFLGILFWLFLFLLIIPIFVHIGINNRIKRLKVKINQGESDIDVQLKLRKDLLLKLIDSVKGSIKFEKELLSTLTSMRTGSGLENSAKNSKILDKIGKEINLQMENYPDLKSTSAIRDLMNSTSEVEETISYARRNYNDAVSTYNQVVSTYPSNVVAKFSRCKYRSFFEVADWDRDDVELKF